MLFDTVNSAIDAKIEDCQELWHQINRLIAKYCESKEQVCKHFPEVSYRMHNIDSQEVDSQK